MGSPDLAADIGQQLGEVLRGLVSPLLAVPRIQAPSAGNSTMVEDGALCWLRRSSGLGGGLALHDMRSPHMPYHAVSPAR